MSQLYMWDAGEPGRGFEFLKPVANRASAGAAVSVDARTLAMLDEIRDQFGLASRGQALDAAVTEIWRRCGTGFTVVSDGRREEEILARIDAMARASARSRDAVMEGVVAAFAELTQTARMV